MDKSANIKNIKVLFIRSINNGLDVISTNQGESLRRQGIKIYYFNILGKGLIGYLMNLFPLFMMIKEYKPNVIHAHYSLSGYLAKICSPRHNIVCSLMGSDVNNSNRFRALILRIFVKYGWQKTIVKSPRMLNIIKQDRVVVIPNGVSLEKFSMMDRFSAKQLIGWEDGQQYILFASDPKRPEKNYKLAVQIFDAVKKRFPNVSLIPLVNIPHKMLVYYYNAANLLLLTSISEGSPNVVKEAMACCCPVVSTDVGDVKDIVGSTEGCIVSNFDQEEMINAVLDLVTSPKRTDGRTRILHLDETRIAGRLIDVYKEMLE